MKFTSTLIAAFALALALPLAASAETAAAKKIHKTQKVHSVNLTSRTAAKATKAAASPLKERAPKMRTAQEPEVIEPVYDYASCGCS